MASIIQVRRDTAANWTLANPVLADGEIAIETDTLKVKFGDGVTAWTSLAYTIETGTYLSLSELTYENLDLNGDVGTGVGQLAIGNHNHTGVYEPADATIVKDASYVHTDNNYTTTEKTKLAGVADNANNYAHPTGDGNLHVPATGTTNNGKVLTAGATAGSLSWTTPSSGITNLGITTTTTTNTITSDTGTDAVIGEATGTAAGLMSVTHHNKLDGIEAGATADQTAAEILTLLKTVDGATSGLDADLLDGQDSSFYRNATNINAGTINDAYLPATISSNITGSSASCTGNAATVTNGVYTNHVQALHATDALRISGDTLSLYKGNGTFESVTLPSGGASIGGVTSTDPFSDGSLVAKYRFESNVTDDTGSYSGTTSLGYTTGKYSSGLNASTTGGATIGDMSPESLLNSYSVSMWINRSNNNSDQLFLTLYNGCYIQIASTGSTTMTAGHYNGSAWYRPTVTIPTSGTWFHVVLTYDGTTINVYINGQLESSLAAPNPIDGNLTSRIGSNTDGNLPAYSVIDQVEIYDRDLSSWEVNVLYTQS